MHDLAVTDSNGVRRAALVTGCSSGIGLCTAVALAEAGYRVFATMRDPKKRAALDAAAGAAGVTLDVHALDVRDTARAAEVVAMVAASGANLDLLVNNAGMGVVGFFEDQSLDEIREQVDTNLIGTLAMMKAVLPGMKARGGGRIVNVTSASGIAPSPGAPVYCGVKYAVHGLSESAHIELAPHGIKVILVVPGMHKTEIFKSNLRVASALSDPNHPNAAAIERMQGWLLSQLEKPGGAPRAVAAAIVEAGTARRPKRKYLCGPDAHIVSLLHGLLPQRAFEWSMQKQLGMMTK